MRESCKDEKAISNMVIILLLKVLRTFGNYCTGRANKLSPGYKDVFEKTLRVMFHTKISDS